MMKRNMFTLKKSLIFTCLIALSSSSNAGIIDLGKITRDTGTNLDWLDLTYSNGKSYTQVLSLLEQDKELYGWRVASTDEVLMLWLNMGLKVNTTDSIMQTDTVHYKLFIKSVELLGNLSALLEPSRGPFDYGILGMTSDAAEEGNEYVDVLGVIHDINDDGTSTSLAHDYNIAHINWKDLGTGTYLVAPSSKVVPEPSTLAIFALGIMGFVSRHFKSKT